MGLFKYGHFGDEIITLCSLLKDSASIWHNVDLKRILVPKDWASFGMDPRSVINRHVELRTPLLRN